MKQNASIREIALRTFIACVGGYYFAIVVTVFIAVLLGEPRANAVINGVLWSFLIHTLIAISAFAVKAPWRLASALLASAGIMLIVTSASGLQIHV